MAIKTQMSPIEIVVGVDEDGGFSREGKIPWYFREDLKHFKTITTGGVCVMGRRTYDEMLQMRLEREGKRKKPNKEIKEYLEAQNAGESPPKESIAGTIKEILPERESFVLTSNPSHFVIGARVVPTLRDAVNSLDETDTRTIFVIGGERLFIEGLAWASKVHMTVIKGIYNCDLHFPVNYLNNTFRIVSAEQTKHLYFVTYERIPHQWQSSHRRAF